MTNPSLLEDEGGGGAGGEASVTSNVTSGVKIPVKPMDKVRRRKKLEDELEETLEDVLSEAFDITFEQFLEELTVPNEDDGLKKRRHTMPQLKEFEKFKADLDKNGIEMSDTKSFNAKDLTPTQSNFNEEKVRGMIDQGTWKNKPIIVSNDDYVIDGHHRWLAASELGKKIEAKVVDMTAEDLLDFLKDKDYVEKHTIKQ